ncbi:MAG TPA: hypothetical protein VH583_11195 [Vicinamibacterales bacterium]|jgi:hypothetical protein
MRFFVLAVATLVLGQPLGPYSGNWTGDFHGTTFVRLTLSDATGTPQGAMSIGSDIHVDKQGNLDGVTAAASTLRPMLDVRRSGEVVSFSYKGDNDVDQFELRLIDANTAELRVLVPEDARQELAADGIPLPKPFRLSKAR